MNTDSGLNCVYKQLGSAPVFRDFAYYIYSLEDYSISYMTQFIDQL